MRRLVDPVTGETVELLPSDETVGGEPFDYSTFRRASAALRREHDQAIQASILTGRALAKANTEFHKQLALAVSALKPKHGATVAETMAYQRQAVYEALEAKEIAWANDRAAMEHVRLAKADREVLLSQGYWSREANSDGWDR